MEIAWRRAVLRGGVTPGSRWGSTGAIVGARPGVLERVISR